MATPGNGSAGKSGKKGGTRGSSTITASRGPRITGGKSPVARISVNGRRLNVPGLKMYGNMKSGSGTKGRTNQTRSQKRSGGLANRSSSNLAKAPTMSNRQYITARAKADIAKVQRAVNSPTGKKVQSAAVGFGKGVAKASKGAISAGKAARSLANRFK